MGATPFEDQDIAEWGNKARHDYEDVSPFWEGVDAWILELVPLYTPP